MIGRQSLGLWQVCFCMLLVLAVSAVCAEQPNETAARVNGKVLTVAELDTAVYVAARQRFYHGRVDDQRMLALRAEVLGGLIDSRLLLDEAKARGLGADKTLKEQFYQRLSRHYGIESMPVDHRLQLEAELQHRAEEQVLLQQIETDVRSAGLPSEAVLKQFYQDNLAKFTTPPRLRLSVILLKVAPSAPVQAWQAAETEAKQLREKLESGASFAKQARLHSGDASAENGGDLGFVHQGMLSREAQQAVDTLEVGEVSAASTLLQGVALFRLEERQEAKVNPFEQVRERAQGLWQREQAEKAWQALLRSLRAKAKIEITDNNMTATMIWAQKTDVVQ